MEAPKFFPTSFSQQFPVPSSDTNKNNNKSNDIDNFVVEDLLDFSNEDVIINDANFETAATSTVKSNNSTSFLGYDPNLVVGIYPAMTISPVTFEGNFSDDLCIPYDDLAELEWLSNVMEESFSSEDLQKMQLIRGVKVENDGASSDTHEMQSMGMKNKPLSIIKRQFLSHRSNPIFNNEVSVPAKARSKRSRVPPGSWTSRLLLISEPEESEYEHMMIPNSIPTPPSLAAAIKKPPTTKSTTCRSGDGSGGDGRRCLHCSTDKTPQWRTGPNGPKTLCNACGVRYKSGRLVPEYRPAASPTFVLSKHSNSHRKVLELRRQKEIIRVQQHHPPHQQYLQHHHHHHPNVMFDLPNTDDYMIYQHVGAPHFRQII